MIRYFLVCCVVVFSTGAVLAQSAGPRSTPAATPMVAPEDVPYPGVIRLHVDATDLGRHIFRVHETIPVRGGESLVLLYPQWLPAKHAAYGRVENLAGLVITAAGERLEWQRDTTNVFAFRVTVPDGVTTLEVDFQFLSATDVEHGRIVMTPEMLNLQWNAVVLYPAGHFARQITVQASVEVPDGWRMGTALRSDTSEGATTVFAPTSLETLVDSPIFAGKYFQRLDLNPDGATPVHLNIVADNAQSLVVTPEQLQAHRALVEQADKLFGSHHYHQYDFLLALTDRLGGIGLEHHESSENGASPAYFTDWEAGLRTHMLLPHEYTHSWNGKFRRPADLWTPSYSVPMRGSLLWVYEGQTQYWGTVLAARAGLLTQQQALDYLAYTAAAYDHQVGRQWRAMQDTTNDPVATMRRPLPWRSWQRGEDYYSEGLLIWLDADTLIRELSRGRRSLDNFARGFFGVNDGSLVPSTYVFDDIVAALNAVQPYDWATFLRTRLDGNGPGAPLDGVRRGGYQLIYTDTPSQFIEDAQATRESIDLTYSVGMTVATDGKLNSVLWDGPVYHAGLTTGNQIIAVNGIAFDFEKLTIAISSAAEAVAGIDLLVKDGDHYRTVTIDYHEGMRYPHLQRAGKRAGYLDRILAPLK